MARSDTDTSTVILTWEIEGKVDIQLTPQHTLYHLCDVVNEEWLAGRSGDDYGVRAHLWQFTDKSHRQEQSYVSPGHFHDEWTEPPPLPAATTALQDVTAATHVGGELELVYDGREITLRLKAIQNNAPEADVQACPRRVPVPSLPSTFRPYVPPTGDGTCDMDVHFPNLATYLLDQQRGGSSTLLLFRPGRKREQAFLEHNGPRAMESVWAPEKFGSVEELFFALDLACANRAPRGFGCNWRSVTMFPSGPLSTSGDKRYAKCLKESKPFRMGRFDDIYADDDDDMEDDESSAMASTMQLCHTMKCDAEWRTANPTLSGTFTQTFPKTAAASQGKKTSQHGWIIYRDGVLTLCHGAAKKTPSTQVPLTLQAKEAFEPLDETCVVATVERAFGSLQELFCMVEALWPW